MIPEAKPVMVWKEFADSPQEWLSQWVQQEAYRQLELEFLLAHADNGVIWGQFDKDRGLQLADNEFPQLQVALSTNTLQQARIFGKRAEIMIWKVGTDWKARIIRDDDGKQYDMLKDEDYWLWGTIGDLGKASKNFTLLVEGGHGFRHAPPTAHLNLGKNERAALKVRHYVDYDDEGQAYIALSRLVGIEAI